MLGYSTLSVRVPSTSNRFGSSAFAYVLITILDDKICVLETLELYRYQFQDCLSEIGKTMIRYHLNKDNTKILVDASAPSVVSGLKAAVGDKVDYLPLLEYRQKNKLRDPFYDFCVSYLI